jgi:DNA-binding response OmpR family regulator
MVTVLVAEDEPAVRELVSIVLSAAGHDLTAAANRMEGICMSGYKDEPIPRKTEFIQKPFQADVFRARVGDLLSQCRKTPSR